MTKTDLSALYWECQPHGPDKNELALTIWEHLRDALATPQDDGLRERIALATYQTMLGKHHDEETISDWWRGESGVKKTAFEVADAIIALLPDGAGWRPEDRKALLTGIADNITELAFRMPAPNEFTPQFVTYANALRTLVGADGPPEASGEG